jgi:hypothetical protein
MRRAAWVSVYYHSDNIVDLSVSNAIHRLQVSPHDAVIIQGITRIALSNASAPSL